MRPPWNETSGWRKLGGRVLDLLYPPVCAVCHVALRDGRSLCEDCHADLPRLAPPFCGSCGESFDGKIDGAFKCPNCSDLKFAFEFARPAMVRDDRTLEMIHQLKYGRKLHLASELGRLAVESFADPRLASALEGNWPLVPVPLHRSRFQHRHFNQAEEIVRTVSRLTGLPRIDALRRVRPTETQTRLSRAQRLENLRGAFAMSPAGTRHAGSDPAGAVLIDDVLTTGSTVDACAKILKRAGFKKIAVVTVMRG